MGLFRGYNPGEGPNLYLPRTRIIIQYNIDKAKSKEPAFLLWVKDSFGYKIEKIYRKQITDLKYLLVYQKIQLKRFRFNQIYTVLAIRFFFFFCNVLPD